MHMDMRCQWTQSLTLLQSVLKMARVKKAAHLGSYPFLCFSCPKESTWADTRPGKSASKLCITRTIFKARNVHLVYGGFGLQEPVVILQQKPYHSRIQVFPDQEQERAAQESKQSWKHGLQGRKWLDHSRNLFEHEVYGDRGVLGEQRIVRHHPNTTCNQKASRHVQILADIPCTASSCSFTSCLRVGNEKRSPFMLLKWVYRGR